MLDVAYSHAKRIHVVPADAWTYTCATVRLSFRSVAAAEVLATLRSAKQKSKNTTTDAPPDLLVDA